MMEAPLRAFLMVRSDDGTWTVTVCRDLGAIVRAWKSRRKPDRDVAVLHVGFDRPPSHSFDKIAIAHPGHMLLTAAAKYALPASFVASTASVGCVENAEVFVGLQGWGYSLQDPTIGADHSKVVGATVTQEPKDWVAFFLKENPATAETLSAHGIYNDTSYLEGESELEQDIRHRLGVFRTHHLIGTKCDDPCELARVAPPWLAKRDLLNLGLSVRASNVFKSSHIKTVQDLAAWSAAALLNQRNFGRRSLRDTLETLYAGLNDGPARYATADETFDEHFDQTSDSGQLLTEMRRSLLSFSNRERDILVRRLGFETTPETLQEVADHYDVTRERIRQIEARATEKWIRESYWDDILEQKITRLLIGRSYPLPVAGVEAIDPWFEGVSLHLEFFKNLVQAVCKDRIHFVDIDGLNYFSLMDQALWERTVSEATVLLSSGAGQEWTEQYARSLVHGLLPDTAREFGALLWDQSSRLCHFSTYPDGSCILTSYGRGAEQLVEAILAESDSPLHYTEIAERANLRQGRSLDPSRAHRIASNIGYLFTRGTYGLARHVPLSKGTDGTNSYGG